jgi:P4 family phage/plasmid primase-like protien
MGEGSMAYQPIDLSYVDFLRKIHDKTPNGYGIEIRRIPGPSRVYSLDGITDPGDLDTSNYYHGVLPRKILTKEIDQGFLIWCDTDGSLDDPSTINPAPSVILHSGRVNGFHLYWRLKDSTPSEKCVELAKLICVALKGDPQVCTKGLTFRAPGSVNTKYTPPRKIEILKAEFDLEYEAGDLGERFVAAIFAPYYIDGERHQCTMALATLLARAGWDLEKSLRTVEYLYNMNPGQDLKGKLEDVRSTYSRIALGDPCSILKLKSYLDKDRFAKLMEGLGITAKDGDILLDGEVIGKLSNIERDFVTYFLGEKNWSSASGKVAMWRNDYWELSDDGIFSSEVFQILARTKYIKQGDTLDLPATSKLAKAVTSMAAGQLHKDPMEPADHHLLPLTNGTLDLRSMEIIPSSKDHRHLWKIPVSYDPSVSSPAWEAFMEEAVPDPSVRDHLQEWMGYCFMAGNIWERLLWLHGPQGTGKSTYIKAIKMLLGPAAVAISSEKFSDYTIAQLAGTRLGVCTELSPRLLRTSVIKALVSGDPVQGRHPYGKPFSVVFDGKLLWGSNELPPLDQGEGMWRRMVPVEFAVVPKKVDNSLKLKIAEQASGVLNWGIIGLKRLLEIEEREESWVLPAAVQKTINTYKTASDPMTAFALEEINLDPQEHVPMLEVYQRWAAWAKERGVYVRPLDPIFFQELAKIGLVIDTTYTNGAGPGKMYLRGGSIKFGIVGSWDKGGMN